MLLSFKNVRIFLDVYSSVIRVSISFVRKAPMIASVLSSPQAIAIVCPAFSRFSLDAQRVFSYKFSKFPVLINGRTYYIRIRNVQIEENPENMFFADEAYDNFLKEMRELLDDGEEFKNRYCEVNHIISRENVLAQEPGETSYMNLFKIKDEYEVR